MIERIAWPYAVVAGLDCRPKKAWFNATGAEHEPLELRETFKGWVIAGRKLRDYAQAEIVIVLHSSTDPNAVKSVFPRGKLPPLDFGYHVLCHETKHRAFLKGKTPGQSEIKLSLSKLGGVVKITPSFVTDRAARTEDGVELPEGAIVGQADPPISLTIDNDWSGDHIPLRWIDFKKSHLPESALVHVQLVGDKPEVWLNERFKEHLKLLDAKGNRLGGLAGAALRELIWVQVWEKVLPWALEKEDTDRWELPATRIADKWRAEFQRQGLTLPSQPELDADDLNTLSLNIQHCLETGRKLSRVKGIFQLRTLGKEARMMYRISKLDRLRKSEWLREACEKAWGGITGAFP